jgi:methionyl aminopeptidase
MSISIKTPEEIEGMRIAGRLGAEVLDYITPFVKPGVTTGELDRLCHEYMVKVQGTVPAPLNYAPPGYPPFPKAVCTSVNDVICHGIPGDKVLKNGDVGQHRRHRHHQGRLPRRQQPHVPARRAVDPGAPPVRSHL